MASNFRKITFFDLKNLASEFPWLEIIAYALNISYLIISG